MTDELRAVHADIAFLKDLAEEGRSTPLLGGSILVVAGTVFGLANFGEWALMSGRLSAPRWVSWAIWLASVAIFMSALAAIVRRLNRAKAGTAANRATAIAWQGAGWTMFTLFASVAIVCWRTRSGVPTLLLPSIIMALYGLGWMVAAAMTGRRWIWLTAIGCYAAALVLAVFSVTPEVYLIHAVALVLFALLPGLVLVRQAGRPT